VSNDHDPRQRELLQPDFDLIGKGSPYSITEHRVLELIPVLGSQPADDVSHKPSGRLPLLSARPTVTLATLKRATLLLGLCLTRCHYNVPSKADMSQLNLPYGTNK